MSTKDLNVRVALSRGTGWTDGSPWMLRITDEASGCVVLDARLSDDEYARIHATQEVTLAVKAELNTGDQLGKRHEILRLDLAGFRGGMKPERMLEIAWAALSPEQVVAGWVPSAYECTGFNGHRRTADGTYRMTYDRYVPERPPEVCE